MSVQCPNCGESISLKGAHPGRFKPRCPACQMKFGLIISTDPGAPPIVARLSAHPQTETLNATVLNALGLDPDPAPPPRAVARRSISVMESDASPVMATAIPTSVAVSDVAATSLPPANGPGGQALSPRNIDLPPQPPAAPIAPPLDRDEALTGSLGGYDLVQKLGQGGMGAVYLARQVSLDRNVAVKVLPMRLAENPMFVARFTREAYAAAQLTHHNVVQIHDIGLERRTHFFSMEFVDGQTLADAVRQQGKLDPEVAVGYILQAARGLKFAHDHGMIHRDIKPDNLLLNDQGVVKVADLGLVKTSSQEALTPVDGGGESPDPATTQPRAMGTPAYMAPEQGQNAAIVDQRADVYALGCTMYHLVTGRPPFTGRTAAELITKHQSEPVTPPEMIAEHVGPTLSAILMKMVAKRVEDRYQNMPEVISALEAYLGVDHAGPFSPREEHVQVLNACVDRFNSTKWNGLRSKIILAFHALCALGVLVCLLPMVGRWTLAGGIVGFAMLTTVSYLILSGITQRTHLLLKARQLIFGASLIDWLKWIIGFAMLIAALVTLGLHWAWLAFALASVLAACGFHFSIDLLLNRDRATPLQHAEHLLRQMRLRGLDEDALRQFVCKYGGADWEEFHEALFGYEAKLDARSRWGKGDKGRDRRRHAAWRDPVIRWIEGKIAARREARQRRVLVKIEENALVAAGYFHPRQARRKAAEKADELLLKATKLKSKAEKHRRDLDKTRKTAVPIITVVQSGGVLDDSGEHEEDSDEPRRERQSYFQRRYGGVSGLLFGAQTRFLLAVVILAGFFLWRYQNREAVVNEMRELSGRREDPTQTVETDPSRAISMMRDIELVSEHERPLTFDYFPLPEIVARLLGSWNAGVAGAILLFGALFRGKAFGLLLLLAATVSFGGLLLTVPIPGPFAPPHLAMLLAAALAILGVFFLRDIRD